MYFVTMTDKFMSGWGKAEGKINKLIFECENYDEACTVFDNAEARDEMTYINIRKTKPYYPSGKYYPQTMTKEDASPWYKPGRFQKQ